MTITPITHPDTYPDKGTPEERTALVTAFADLAAFYAVNENAPLPATTLNIPVPRGPRGLQLDLLRLIADAIGACPVPRDGMLTAERRFGPLVLEAHVPDDEAPGYGPFTAGSGAAA